jgi:heat shock protein HtpX
MIHDINDDLYAIEILIIDQTSLRIFSIALPIIYMEKFFYKKSNILLLRRLLTLILDPGLIMHKECELFLMVWFKRIFLFFLINCLVIFTVSCILHVLHIEPYLAAYGINYSALFSFCLIWGVGGAFISLLLSRTMAKWMLGVKIIDPRTQDRDLRHVLNTVERLSNQLQISTPEVGIYTAKEVNAFATGPSKRRSLIALSSGLLQKMKDTEIEGILGHEMAHIINGDMVTMTLLQGVVNAFVMFLARVLAYFLSFSNKDEKQGSYLSFYLLTMFFEMIFMLFGFILIAAYSRFREYRADEAGACLAGKQNMLSALCSLRVLQDIRDLHKQKDSLQAFKISSSRKQGLLRWFSTHPPLEARIARLQKKNITEYVL